jgi:ABC-type Fe3+-hydroxamate transport system substrate-binding protein
MIAAITILLPSTTSYRRLAADFYTDQLGRRVSIPYPPVRIISLVPSQTELLYDLGAKVAGITKFCVHPDEWFRTKPRIGGTKQLDIAKIRALLPDLIIANKEENEEQQVKALMEEFPVWTSDIHTLEDALSMIKSLGEITGTADKAVEMIGQIRKGFEEIPVTKPVKAAYLIWRNPWMAAGEDTFINDMMKVSGLQNIFPGRYPVVTPEQLKDCPVILLSSEPYPFKEQHLKELQAVAPNARIILVDGEMYSWYGSRLIQSPAYFRTVISII